MGKYRLLAAATICSLLLSLWMAFLPTPILADSVTFYPSKDNYLNSENTTTNYGTSTSFYVGMWSSSQIDRALLEFSINWSSNIPVGATITAATLQLWEYGVGGSAGRTYYAQRLLRLTWSETQSTWNVYTSGSSWGIAGAGSSVVDYTTSGQASAIVPSTGGQWMSWDVLTQIQYARSNNISPEFRIIDSSEQASKYTVFRSKDYSVSSQRPKLVIIYVIEPTISTLSASNIAATSVRLNSALESDGGDNCTIKFGWGLTSESAIGDYDSYETLSGTYTTGNYPYLDVSGLLSGYTYYFRVSATNIIGTDVGDELTFATPIILEAPTNFIGYPEATSISLSWSKGTGSTNTLVRYGQTTYPSTITEGIEAYFGPSSTYTLASLTSGKTYYFRAWGETGGNYSASYATLLMTTSASVGTTTPDMDVPTQPSRWFSAPDYSSMAGLGIIYTAFNGAMDIGDIPRETGWFLGAVGLAMIAGLIAYLKLGKKLMIGLVVLTVGLAMGYFVRLVPWWFPLMTLILTIAFSMTHKQVNEG